MATGKRFYWMKLKENFMTSDTIDYFMSQPDGANYVVLYQMLCLKTINTDGRLSRQIGEVVIKYDIPKIQRDLKWFSADTIRVALNLYKAFGLVYEDVDGTLVLTDHRNLVGSETDAASRMRNVRSRRIEASHENVTQSEHSANIVTPEIENRDRDKSIEKEIDLTVSNDTVCRTSDVRRVVDAWNSLSLTQVEKVTGDSVRGKMLRARIKEYGTDDVVDAVMRIQKSSFLRGQNKKGWTITFDWLVRPNNFTKVKEGQYDDSVHGNQSLREASSSNPFLREDI